MRADPLPHLGPPRFVIDDGFVFVIEPDAEDEHALDFSANDTTHHNIGRTVRPLTTEIEK